MRKIMALLLLGTLCFSVFAAAVFASGEAEETESVTGEEGATAEETAPAEEPTEAEETMPAFEDAVETPAPEAEEPAADGETEGVCGENALWRLTDDGILTISGTGPMTDYRSNDTTPWYPVRFSVREVVIGEGITSVGNNAFANYPDVTDITLPDSVTVIGTNAFIRCKGVSELRLPAEVTSIGVQAFKYCGMSELDIPATVTELASLAFGGCESLKTIRFLGAPPEMAADVFSDVTAEAYYSSAAGWTEEIRKNYRGKLTWIALDGEGGDTGTVSGDTVIGEGVCGDSASWRLTADGVLTVSGTGAMTDYPSNDSAPWYDDRLSVREVVIEDGITSVGNNAFANYPEVTAVTLPDSVTVIGTNAFAYCRGVREVKLPAALTSIGVQAFGGCGLSSVTVPETVTEIGDHAFSGCADLKMIRFLGAPPEMAANVFFNVIAETYYVEDAGWTEETMKNYNGRLTWIGAEDKDSMPPELTPAPAETPAVPEGLLRGDVNLDGKVDRQDRVYLARALEGWEDYSLEWPEAQP